MSDHKQDQPSGTDTSNEAEDRGSKGNNGAGEGHDRSDKKDEDGDQGDEEDGDDGSGKSDETDDDDDDDDDDDEKDKKPSLFKRPLFWIILIAVVAALVIGGTLYWLHARQFQSTDDAFVDSHIVRISPQVAGQLVAVADIDNRHVDAGRLLAVVQPTGPEAQLAEAQAGVVQAQAQYGQALAQVDAARATARQQQAASRAPLAAAIKAQQDLARYEALLRADPSAVAGQQLDQARAAARQTAADAAAARRQVDTARSQVDVAARGARAARAGIATQRARVQQANVTLGDLRLRAPVSGQVVNRQVNLGSYVAPGTQLMAIVPDRVWITANFKETQLAEMKIGQPVTIKVDAFPDVEFHGHVDSIQRGAGQAFAVLPPQNATGNYVKVVQRVPVRIEFDRGPNNDAPDPRRYPIGPGMSAVPTVKVR
ncbi:membrane fusion protein, multidrug efflux system [Sphingomonas gellani]|uniref:Membrane fusion protein, multidrug efflux system n=1 Tax=Sphingomonas gellani TaxID=1166340 RepID=A0A1H8EU98_9SPHN|nr:HlyD family secretion protein [Sphingomonas gellani]SEN23045.1 membrane fusion protein, multidrug efflux system [Sphingomonas gellani]